MQAPKVKLPILRTAGEAYLIAIGLLGYWLRISWVWMLITAPPLMLAYAVLYNSIAPEQYSDAWVSAVSTLIYVLVPLPMFASTAVAWHRRIIEGPTVQQPKLLDISRSVRRYAVVLLLFQLLIQIPFFCGRNFALDSFGHEIAIAIMLLGLSIAFIAFLVVCRLSVFLVATALERPDATTAWGWRAGTGNTRRILWGSLLTFLPCFAIEKALDWAVPPSTLSAWIVFETFHAIITNTIAYLPTLAFLTLAYIRLELAPKQSEPQPT